MRLRPSSMLMLALAAAGGCRDPAAGGSIGARDRILAVGSSTVFPFTALVAERFVMESPNAAAPVIESTGTGAGMRLFCSGIGAATPDIAGASRRMRADEYRSCVAHGVRDVIELPIGRDGIAFAQAKSGPTLTLTPALLYRALAAEPGGHPNASQVWRQLDPALPATPIRVYGPPPTSGTRDALTQRVLATGCLRVDPAAATLAAAPLHDRCVRLREDGAFADSGEQDNLIVQKLVGDPDAIGVFGYATLLANRGAVRALPLDGVKPTTETIASGRYPGARTLYLYVKSAHLDAVPGLRAFMRRYAASTAPGGPLARRGLIALPPAGRALMLRAVAAETRLDPETLA